MKLTKAKLIEMVKQELKEFTATSGGTATLQQKRSGAEDIKTKKTDKASKKSTWDTAKATYQTKSDTYDSKLSTFNTKDTARNLKDNQKYRKAGARPGTYLYRSAAQGIAKGYSLNPDWTTADNERTTAASERDTAETEKNTAETDRDRKEAQYNTAVSDLSAAEKADKAFKKQTGFGFGAGGGGRAGGKGGTAKKGGTKDESLFRILGRELVKELKDIKKYS